MRLHRLELQAFGPFADKVAVDLDALGADGLFLLHGETGAGKTTLLDAVAFALYGRVPGARGEAKQLRCDRAAPTTATTVTLELTLGGRRMVITRSPDYEREKTRGSGTTTQKAKVTLRWVGAPPHGLPAENLTSAKEVGEVMLDLLGMSADQFFQVVLLPQGEFARFLRADTAEREVLLEKLFDTGRFAAIESWFAQARRWARAAADEAESVVAQELARVAEAAGIPTEGALVSGSLPAGDKDAGIVGIGSATAREPADAVPAAVSAVPGSQAPDASWLALLRTHLADHAMQADKFAGQAREVREETAVELATGVRRDAAVVKLTELRAEQVEVDAGAQAYKEMVAAVAAAELAGPVVAADRAVAAAESARVRSRQAVSMAREAVPAEFRPELGVIGTHELDLDSGLFSLEEDGSAHVAVPDAEVLRVVADGIRDLAGSLGALVGLADEQHGDTLERTRVQDELARAECERADMESDFSSAPQRREAAEHELEVIRERSGRLVDCDLAVTSATEIRDAAASVTVLRPRLGAAEAAHHLAVDAHQRATDERQALVERRIAGMAAELAGQLEDGAPCAVCGSKSHPLPAVADYCLVDAAAVGTALQRERDLETARAEADCAAAALRTALAAASAAAHGLDEAAAGTRFDEVIAVQLGARQASDQLPGMAAAVQAMVSEQEELAKRRTALLERMQGLRTTVATLDAALATRSGRLAEAADGFDSVLARRDHLLAVAAGLDDWAGAAEVADRDSVAAVIARQQRDKAVAEAGFVDSAVALTAAELDLHRAREAIRLYEERALVVSTRLADPDLQLDGPLARIDVAALKSRAEAAAAQAEIAASGAHQSNQRCRQVEAAAARLGRAWRAHAPLAQEADNMTALAEVVAGRGQNSRALSLRSYVLAAKLQQVAGVAGERLSRMSGGRYSFVYSDQREARGKSGGLGLDILDAYSGQVRPAKTLSGGESFLASLALALGLADVVAAESGGRMLDTIFIDEGFGSLDAEALDLVMTTLDELRAGGRVVGVVSHVDEMRQRIPRRLRVRKIAKGSDVEMSGW